ncbi:MAG: TolC family protein [Helicobacteraceae bacterium]|jgi:outer membrane protein TolC|nr:TolC family protein [Helicobacteraceae bacterium]
MKALFVSLCLAILLNALTIDEAISLSLQNHHAIKEAGFSLSSANAQENAAFVNFLPTLEAGYSRYERDIKTSAAVTTRQLRASLNLFRGLGDFADLRMASWTKNARLFEFEGTKADVILETKQAFFGYLRARDTQKSAEAQLQAAKKRCNDAIRFYNLGLIATYDRQQIELDLLQAEQTALKAKSDLSIARQALESMIGMSIDSEPQAVRMPRIASIDLTSLRETMQTQRSEIRTLNALIEAQKNRKLKTVSSALPSVDIYVAKERYEYESGQSGINEQTTAAITATWRLDGFIKPYFERQSALYEQRVLESRLADLRRTLNLQLANTYERFVLAVEAFGVAQTALTVARENERIVQNRFEAQLAGASDMTEATALFWRAQEQYTNFYYDQLSALSELERVTESEFTKEDYQ